MRVTDCTNLVLMRVKSVMYYAFCIIYREIGQAVSDQSLKDAFGRKKIQQVVNVEFLFIITEKPEIL